MARTLQIFDKVMIKCTSNTCGFIVHDRYFEQKRKFAPGMCPRCGNATKLVYAGTNTESTEHVMDVSTGAVEIIKPEASPNA